MRPVLKLLGILLLMMVAQQGAVVHELSHVSAAVNGGLRVQSDGAADTACALCPAFAQVVAPAFGHSFRIPLLVRFALGVVSEREIIQIGSAVPRPRSRGPPSLS